MSRIPGLLLAILMYLYTTLSQAAPVVNNGSFTSGTTGWACAPEVNTASTYGGSGTNNTAEVGAAAGLCQTISGFTVGTRYILSVDVSRRTGSCPGPNPATANIVINGSALTTTVTRSNTTFSLTTSTFTFTATNTTHVLTISAAFVGTACGIIFDNITITPSPVSNLTLTSVTTASVCSGLTVTIAALDNSGGLYTGYTGVVTLSTSSGHGTWSKTSASGILVAGSDTGTATYTFVAGDVGDAVFTLTNTHADNLTISVSDVVNSLGTTSGVISFRDNVFVITSSDSHGSDVVAGRNHNFRATLWKQDATTGNCSVATNYTGSKNLKAWITRDAFDPAGVAPTIAAVSLPNTAPGSNNLSGVSFSSGVYNFTLGSSDVGKYAINLRDDSLLFMNRNIDGSSNGYVVRPFGFAIDFSGDRAANGTSGISYASTASGSAFAKAGQNFSTTVRAVQWQSVDDANGDGMPDSGANLYDNSATAAFDTSVTTNPVLVAPSGGVLGSISGAPLSGFSNGSKTALLNYSEVGIINLTASSNNYLGGGNNITGTVLNVGRFYPDHFSVSTTNITPYCSAAATSFTYMNQPFTATALLSARNAANNVTSNYTGSFAKLNTASNADMHYVAADTTLTPTTSLTSRLTMNNSSGNWNNGIANVSASLTLARRNGVNGGSVADGAYDNFKPGIAPTDNDGVVLNSVNLDSDANGSNDALALGMMAMRYGRYVLNNSVGSELANLPVAARLEYYADNNSGFISHSNDTCTTFANSNFTLANWSANLNSGETSVMNVLTLSAPGNGNYGSVDVTGSGIPAWLTFDWNSLTAGDEFPKAKAVFGVYGGGSPLVYRRETYR